jgi:hypothetical protein
MVISVHQVVVNDELGGHSRELQGMSLNCLRPSCGLVAQYIDSKPVLGRVAIATITTNIYSEVQYGTRRARRAPS